MSVWEHSRWKIFNESQHPLKHDLSALAYTNARFPSISTLTDFLDAMAATLYPQYKETVATPADLSSVSSPQPNDYVIVTDDGDGKSAGYVYAVIEGAGTWYKRYDPDWSMDGIFAELTNRTQYMYVQKYGMDDRDASGTDLTGDNAGQHIYGGTSAGTHLTLHANSANSDTSGFVQFADNARPQVDSMFDLGTDTYRWSHVYADALLGGDVTVSNGSVTSSSGTIDFDDNDLTTTGDISAANLGGTTATFGTLTLAGGSITDSTGAISFDNENLTTTGDVTAANVYATSSVQVGPLAGNQLILGAGSITDESGAISFGNENLTTTGTLSAGDTTLTKIDVDNIELDGNTISTTDTDGDLILAPNGTGVVDVQKGLTTLDQTVTGTVSITGQLNADNLRLDGNVISSTDTNGNITLTPNGTGQVESSATIFPTTSSAEDLGKTGQLWDYLWLSGGIRDGTNTFEIADLMSLRSSVYRDSGRTQPAQAGDTIFWDGSQWLASVPDTEINHPDISGLTTGDAGHTQFVMLAGRSGGQTVQGGTGASENLILESTSDSTKGDVLTKDNFIPYTNASYSASWAGTDLGDGSHYFRDVYTKGEFKGLRLENFTVATLPSSSGSAAGRLVFATDSGNVYVDNGSTFKLVGGGGGGGSIQWVEDADAPAASVDNHCQVYSFEDALTQNLYALIKVPSGYSAGSPIKLKVTPYCSDSSGTMLIAAQSTLIRPGTDAISSTTNRRTTTNGAITLSGGTVNVPQAVDLDITSSTGQINSVAVSAGDLILVKLYRDTATDTATGNVLVPVYGAEVTFV